MLPLDRERALEKMLHMAEPPLWRVRIEHPKLRGDYWRTERTSTLVEAVVMATHQFSLDHDLNLNEITRLTVHRRDDLAPDA